MTDYTAVQPSMLCATCPWDRSCISPPTMTRAEIDAKMAAAAAQDDAKLAEAKSKRHAWFPFGDYLHDVPAERQGET